MKKIQLSVVVVSYNTEKQLVKCLASIVTETQTIPTQLIVIDNASNDGSIKEIQNAKIKYQNQIQNVKFEFINNKVNLGYSKAVNQGFNEAGGEVVLLLNADTILTKCCLKNILEFEKTHQPCVIGPQLLNPDKTIQPSVFHLPTLMGAIKEYWFGQIGTYSKYTPSGNQPVKVEAVLGGAMVISKAVIDKVGNFDEKYFMYFEDLDFCRRVGRSGFPIYYLPTAQIIHEHGASGKSLADSANQWRRMIPSSKIYLGLFRYWLITVILWCGQKIRR